MTQEPSTLEDNQAEMDAIFIKRRKGCIIRLIASWMVIGFFLVVGMTFVRSNVERDADVIDGFVTSRFVMEMPERFQPYSMTHYFGTLAISYWSQTNLREDGRTLDLFSIFQESGWAELSLDEVIEGTKADWDQKLRRNEFHTKRSWVEEREEDGLRVRIHVFEGVANLEGKLVEAITCFRFIDCKEGPVQMQTLGLVDSFTLVDQIKLLSSVKAV